MATIDENNPLNLPVNNNRTKTPQKNVQHQINERTAAAASMMTKNEPVLREVNPNVARSRTTTTTIFSSWSSPSPSSKINKNKKKRLSGGLSVIPKTITIVIESLIADGVIDDELVTRWEMQMNQGTLLDYAQSGIAPAMIRVAACYEQGLQGFPINFREAYKWSKRAHQAGNVDGTYLLGKKLLMGQGVAQDIIRGSLYVDIAARKGCPRPAFHMGMNYALGRNGVPQSNVEAIRWLQKALDSHYKVAAGTSASTMVLSEAVKQRAQMTLYALLKQQHG